MFRPKNYDHLSEDQYYKGKRLFSREWQIDLLPSPNDQELCENIENFDFKKFIKTLIFTYPEKLPEHYKFPQSCLIFLWGLICVHIYFYFIMYYFRKTYP